MPDIHIVISADPNTSLSTIRAAASGAVRRINNDSPLVSAALVSAGYAPEPESDPEAGPEVEATPEPEEKPKAKPKAKAKAKPADE